MNELEARINRLERSNSRLRLAVLVTLLLPFGLVLMGQGSQTISAKKLEANELEIFSADGKSSLTIGQTDKEFGILIAQHGAVDTGPTIYLRIDSDGIAGFGASSSGNQCLSVATPEKTAVLMKSNAGSTLNLETTDRGCTVDAQSEGARFLGGAVPGLGMCVVSQKDTPVMASMRARALGTEILLATSPEKRTWTAGTDPDGGNPRIIWFDESGKATLAMPTSTKP